MTIQQGLQHHHHVGLGDPGGSLHHHRLVELVDRPLDGVQPTHDRGGHHRPDTLVDHARRTVGQPGHPGQPGHGLLDEDVAGPTRQTGRAGPGHHLHRQNAVPAQVEERVIDPDAVQAQHLGVDAGQDFLDRVGRGAVPSPSSYSGAGRARVSSL